MPKFYTLSYFRLFIYLFLFFVVFSIFAQNHPVDGNYIRAWLVLGPFFPNDLAYDFLTGVGGEAKIEPKEGDTITTVEGTILTWKRYKAKGNIVDLVDAVGRQLLFSIDLNFQSDLERDIIPVELRR
ncbi:hypothetical protein FJZ31_37625, partial [Candidatus Poribacteria bacterium]|nr:hypothetical protein [Candidatus Poribacteria bacterium]